MTVSSRRFAQSAALAAALSIASASAADPPVNPLIASAALRGDAAVLRQVYEALHPGLYRYNTRDELDRRFAELERALDHDQTVGEAFVAFTRFTATIRCGHSYPNFSNQPRAVLAVLTRGANRLPFWFTWIDGSMVVTDNFSGDPALARGTIVDSIGGIATRQVLDDLMRLARADGRNDAKRVSSLEVQGFDRVEAFDVYFPLVYPRIATPFELTVRARPESPLARVVVAGITHLERLAAMERRSAVNEASPLGWTLDFPVADTAVLRMPTWAAFNTKWDWKAFLQQSFETLAARRTSHLVIDLRGNEGGSSVGDEIAAHLVDHDVPEAAAERRTIYRTVPVALRPVLDTWDRSFFDWGADAVGPDDHGFYRLTKYDDTPDGSVVKPIGPRFTGRVDVLVDASNSSATFEFARLVQTERLGTLVGAPTGGNLRGINGGAFFFARLPASRIEVDVPLIGQFPRDGMPDRGVLPDVPVRRSVDDVRDGVDAAMRRVLGTTTAAR